MRLSEEERSLSRRSNARRDGGKIHEILRMPQFRSFTMLMVVKKGATFFSRFLSLFVRSLPVKSMTEMVEKVGVGLEREAGLVRRAVVGKSAAFGKGVFLGQTPLGTYSHTPPLPLSLSLSPPLSLSLFPPPALSTSLSHSLTGASSGRRPVVGSANEGFR